MEHETKIEPNVKQVVPFFAVSNIERSVRYYVDGLGFEMTKKMRSRMCFRARRLAIASAHCSLKGR